MEIEEGSQKEWGKLKQSVEKTRDRLSGRVDKLNEKAAPKLAQGTVIKTKFELSFFNEFTLPKRELQVTEYTEVHLV
jgi:hypothetical protein